MDSSDNSLSAIDSIDTVAFKIGLRGYGVDEVDEFLERLSSEVRQLQDLAKQQRQQLRQAAERTRDGLWQRIGTLLDQFTPDECANYLRAAGYGDSF